MVVGVDVGWRQTELEFSGWTSDHWGDRGDTACRDRSSRKASKGRKCRELEDSKGDIFHGILSLWV